MVIYFLTMQVYIPYKLAYVLIIFELNMIVSSYIHACKYSLHIIIIFFKILCLQFLFKRLYFYKLRYFYENFVDFKNEISDQSQAGGIDPTMQNGRSTLVLSLLNPSLSSAYTHIYTCCMSYIVLSYSSSFFHSLSAHLFSLSSS